MKEWCDECGRYTEHVTGGCMAHSLKITITDHTTVVPNAYDHESDPTIFRCQHKIADMNGYKYCPQCGEMM